MRSPVPLNCLVAIDRGLCDDAERDVTGILLQSVDCGVRGFKSLDTADKPQFLRIKRKLAF
jgi:hypothetical protein